MDFVLRIHGFCYLNQLPSLECYVSSEGFGTPKTYHFSLCSTTSSLASDPPNELSDFHEVYERGCFKTQSSGGKTVWPAIRCRMTRMEGHTRPIRNLYGYQIGFEVKSEPVGASSDSGEVHFDSENPNFADFRRKTLDNLDDFSCKICEICYL